jgi:hypothetical protein
MQRLQIVIVCIGLMFFGTISSASAQTPITVSDSSLVFEFPKSMTFQLRVQSTAEISVVGLAIHFPATGLTTRPVPKFTSGKQVDASYTWDLRATGSTKGGYLPPGAMGEYSWHIEDVAGNKLDTPFKSFQVQDQRFNWKELKNDQIAVHWYLDNDSVAQSVFDKANSSLPNIQETIGVPLERPVQIWIYTAHSEFLSAISPTSSEQTTGVTEGDHSVILLEYNPYQDILLSTSFQLTGQVIDTALKGGLGRQVLPNWMNLGLSIYHEQVPPRNEARFESALQQAIKTGTLLSLEALSDFAAFEGPQSELAFGESYSVVEFIIRQYGRDKIRQLLALFKRGVSADSAFQQVLGVDQNTLENLWRKSIGAPEKESNKAPTATPAAVPTLGLSSADTPTLAPETATPPRPALAATSAPPANATPASKSSGGGLCGGLVGAMGLVAVGLWRIPRRKQKQD